MTFIIIFISNSLHKLSAIMLYMQCSVHTSAVHGLPQAYTFGVTIYLVLHVITWSLVPMHISKAKLHNHVWVTT